MDSIRKILTKKSNDYSWMEKIFWQNTGSELLSDKKFRLPDRIDLKMSIIIPTYNSNLTLEKILLSIASQEELIEKKISVEVIIIDDGSKEPIYNVTNKFEKILDLVIIRTKNQGSGEARNLGIRVAKNDIILFLDSDVILSKSLLANHLFVHQSLPAQIILVSFRENIGKNNIKLNIKNIKNGIAADEIDISKDFRLGSANDYKIGYNIVRGKECNLLLQSNYFKNFGHQKKIGLTTLPYMALTFCMSCRRKELIEVGGCPSNFKGWGFNDVSMAAKLLAKGCYLLPNLNSRLLHIRHKFRTSKLPDAIQVAYKRNKKNYEQMLDLPLEKVYQPFN